MIEVSDLEKGQNTSFSPDTTLDRTNGSVKPRLEQEDVKRLQLPDGKPPVAPPCGNLDFLMQTMSVDETPAVPPTDPTPSGGLTSFWNWLFPSTQEETEQNTFTSWMTSAWKWLKGEELSKDDPFVALTEQEKESVRHVTAQIQNIFIELRRETEENAELKSFIEYLLQVYKQRQDDLEELAKLHAKDIEKKRTQWFKKQEVHQEKMQKWIETLDQKQIWDRLTSVVAPLGTAVAALALPPLAREAVLLVALTLAADALFDNPAKKQLAKLIGQDDQEKSRLWEGRLATASFMLSIGLSLPLPGGPQGLAIMMGVMQGGLQLGQTHSQRQLATHQADLTRLRYQIDEWQKKISSIGGQSRQLNEQLEHLHKTTHNLLEKEVNLAKDTVR